MKAKQITLFDDIIVDNFAGGGGASTGMELATGRPVNIAINHDESAILMHQRNHPYTEHYREDVWMIDPKTVTRGRHVRLAWFSPDCKHFSRAKGKALVNRNIRGLAWIVLRWAGTVRPDVIMLENVPEFVTWGPVRKGKPVKSKKGKTYEKWYRQLRDLGYWPQVRAMLNEYCGYKLADNEVLLLRIKGIWYFISDIGLRMLAPRELYNAMGFPADYIIDRDNQGNEIKRAAQVARCGNAVCPPLAEALTRANLPECSKKRYVDMRELHDVMVS